MARGQSNSGSRDALIGLLGIILGGAFATIANYIVNERQIDVKMIEIAVGLLKEDPNGPLQPARKWAVDVTALWASASVLKGPPMLFMGAAARVPFAPLFALAIPLKHANCTSSDRL
jgi:hypothetical protein